MLHLRGGPKLNTRPLVAGREKIFTSDADATQCNNDACLTWSSHDVLGGYREGGPDKSIPTAQLPGRSLVNRIRYEA